MKKLLPALILFLMFSCAPENVKEDDKGTVSEIVDSLLIEKKQFVRKN